GFFVSCAEGLSREERMQRIKIHHPKLSISAKCRLLSISRASVYYQPQPRPAAEMALLRQIDQYFLDNPCLGSRKMTALLRRDGQSVSRKKVQRLMRQLGIQAVYAKPNTSQPHPLHPTYPYLLRGLEINRANQVWCSDITYIPMQRGFLYLVAVMDWYSRNVLSWRVSNTLEADFCVGALQDALRHFGTPAIFNTDQGSQFTSQAFTGTLQDAGVQISMDGRGRYLDNIFIERLWRTVKHECIYLHAPATGTALNALLKRWIHYYNQQRPHQSLNYQTPHEFYLASLTGSSTLNMQPPALAA
ncbi:MAG: IS3 family transposase, partial [Leptolyngbya sp. SIO4C1]|nr:IS3 family transposase [Leptolyngbya sp. SIO4C1]